MVFLTLAPGHRVKGQNVQNIGIWVPHTHIETVDASAVFTNEESGRASFSLRRANDFVAMRCVIALVVLFLYLQITSTTGAI